MSGTRRFWFGNVSADSTQFDVMSDLIRSWISLESVSGRPTYARYITDLRPTNHLPSVAELRPTRPRTLPDKTDTTPTYNRQTTDNLSGRDLSNMFERSHPDKCVCPNINRHQTDKTESIPNVNRSLPEFEDFWRFEVGFVSVWPVWLGYYVGLDSVLNRSWILGNRHETDLKPTKIIKFGVRSVYSRYWFGVVGLVSVYVRADKFVEERSFKHVWKISPRQIVGCLLVISVTVWCRFCRGAFGDVSVSIRPSMVDVLSVVDRLCIGPTWHRFMADLRPNQVRHNTELRGVGRHIPESKPTSARHISNPNRM